MDMGVKDRLRRLEQQTESYYNTLRLPDGTEVRYRAGSPHNSGDAFNAFIASMKGEEHWLLPYIRQMDTTTGFSGLINALEGSRARIMKAKDADEE
jgi:hypothetical protein